MSESAKSSDPWDSITLPSKFKPYKEDECIIRPLKTGEVRKVEALVAGRSELSIVDIVKDAVKLDVNKLTLGDFWYILSWLRINTYKNYPFLIEWACPNSHKNTLNIEFSKLKIGELPDEFEEPIQLKISDTVTLPMRLPRVGDEKIVANYLKKTSIKSAPTPEDEEQASQAIQIDNGRSLYENIELLKTIEDSPDGPEAIMKIEALNIEFQHGLPRFLEDTCKECEYHADDIHFSFRFTDLAPSRTVSKNIRSSVSFGKASTRTAK
jgi:hypothetical protein